MLGDAVVELVREAGGDALLLDARNRRCIVSDTGHLADILKRLRNAGFTRLIDFSAQHHEADEFAMFLTLRHPGHGHDELTLKWKWRITVPQEPETEPSAQNGDAGGEEAPDAGYNVNGGAGRSGGHPRRTGPVLHPSLSLIWPAAGLAEREMFEMFGIAFRGNENLKPLLICEAFRGNPLRNDFKTEKPESYAAKLLKERHQQGLLDAVGRQGGGP